MKNYILKLTLVSIIAVSSSSIFAAQITAKYVSIEGTTNNSIEVYLDTEGETVNTIEGSMLLDGFSSEIISISTRESKLPLWPNKPSLVGSKLSFIGGVPKGILGNDILLFTINLRAAPAGEFRILPNDLNVYLNNGKGDLLKVKDRTIFITKDDIYLEASSFVDTTPPAPFVVELGRDVAAYDGKYFISFFTTDEGSGIDHYDIQEGSSTKFLADSPYVLRDQSLRSSVYVTAYDTEGNATVAIYKPEYKLPIKIKISIILIVSLLTIGLLRISWIKVIKKKHLRNV